MRRVNASAYIRVPFDVVDATDFDLLVLRMKFEDGFIAYLNGVEVARENAPDDSRWDSDADGSRLTSDALEFEDYDITAGLEHVVPGRNVLAIHGMNSTTSGSDFFIYPTLVGVKLGPLEVDRPQFFDRTTAAWPNGRGFDRVSGQPGFSVSGGAFSEPVTVELSSPVPGAEIRLTLDNSEPTRESPLNEGPVQIDQTTVIKAILIEPDQLPSLPTAETYLFISSNLKDFSSNLPIVTVNTFGRSIPGNTATTYAPIHLVVFDLDDDGRASFSGPVNFHGRGGIRVRGSSSSGFPKQNFAVETWDVDDEDKDVKILDFAAESDWILHGPYSDKTLMRNVLAYEWSNDIGRWAVKTRFVELYLNRSANATISSRDYWGVYVLMEKIKIGPDRLNITKMLASENSEPEITGGYVMKKDRADPGDVGFATPRQGNLRYYSPKEKGTGAGSPQQLRWIDDHLTQFENTLYGPRFTDPENGYRKYIDVDSFIDHHILVEICKNIDGYRLSTFFFKDRGQKVNMGPIWDYNLSLGNADYLDGWKPTGWYYALVSSAQYPWYPRLFQDAWFERRYAARWSELRQGPLRLDKLLASIEKHVELLDESQARNFGKWRRLGVYDWPNAPGVQQRRTYEAVIQFMKDWLVDRVAWMDTQLSVPPEITPPGGRVEPGLEVTITAPSGQVFYTLDGSDPRAANGKPAESSLEYVPGETRIIVDRNVLVMARASLNGGVWTKLISETYIIEDPTIALTEIMYNPGGEAGLEFLEIHNFGEKPVDLSFASFSTGVRFEFAESPVKSLEPGHYAVLVRDQALFAQHYDTSLMTIAGEYTGDLRDSGESLRMRGSANETIFSFRYRDTWYPETDGSGPSLVLVDPTSPVDSWKDATSWMPSSESGGSPGRGDSVSSHGQVPGDSNQDGKLNVADVIHLLGFLFQGGDARLPCGRGGVADAPNLLLLNSNGDFAIDAADAIYNITYIFLNGAPPVLGVQCIAIPGCPDACSP